MRRCVGLDTFSGIQTDIPTPPVRDTAIIGSFKWMMGDASCKVWRLAKGLGCHREDLRHLDHVPSNWIWDQNTHDWGSQV